jgi:hypothetical protein
MSATFAGGARSARAEKRRRTKPIIAPVNGFVLRDK